jgi:hypothetical protein
MTWAQEFARKLREEEQAKIAKVKAAACPVCHPVVGNQALKETSA